ncbi:MAG: NYN domain-containing protein [Actinomycetes bacterium]
MIATSKKEVVFIIDGLNLFHSIIHTLDLQKTIINLEKLCNQVIKENEVIKCIELFGSIYKGNNPTAIYQRRFFNLNKKLNLVSINLGILRQRKINCKKCLSTIIYYQEKHTDVNIGIRLFETYQEKKNGKIYFISADDDFTPLIKKILHYDKSSKIVRVLPPGRFSKSFQPSIFLKKTHILKSSF